MIKRVVFGISAFVILSLALQFAGVHPAWNFGFGWIFGGLFESFYSGFEEGIKKRRKI